MLLAGCCCIKEDRPCKNWSTCDSEWLYMVVRWSEARTDNNTYLEQNYIQPGTDPEDIQLDIFTRNDTENSLFYSATFGVYLQVRKENTTEGIKQVYALPTFFQPNEAIEKGYIVPYGYGLSGKSKREEQRASRCYPSEVPIKTNTSQEEWNAYPYFREGIENFNTSPFAKFIISENFGYGDCSDEDTCYLNFEVSGIFFTNFSEWTRDIFGCATNKFEEDFRSTTEGYSEFTTSINGTAKWVKRQDNALDDCTEIPGIMNTRPKLDTFGWIVAPAGGGLIGDNTGGPPSTGEPSCYDEGWLYPSQVPCNLGGPWRQGSKNISCGYSQSYNDPPFAVNNREFANWETDVGFSFTVLGMSKRDEGPEDTP